MSDADKIKAALELAAYFGGIDGSHHKMWTIDQMVRALTDCPKEQKKDIDSNGKPYTYEGYGESEDYKKFITEYKSGKDGPETYQWDEGIAP